MERFNASGIKALQREVLDFVEDFSKETIHLLDIQAEKGYLQAWNKDCDGNYEDKWYITPEDSPALLSKVRDHLKEEGFGSLVKGSSICISAGEGQKGEVDRIFKKATRHELVIKALDIILPALRGYALANPKSVGANLDQICPAMNIAYIEDEIISSLNDIGYKVEKVFDHLMIRWE